MCGVVGIISKSNTHEKAFTVLERLEYRGYDSAGIASVYNGDIHVVKAVGKIETLKQKYNANTIKGNTCIGHMRWATHGVPSEKNAHPIVAENVAVVHNGIVENYAALREELSKDGVVFTTETDTEVITHLLNNFVLSEATPLEAVLKTVKLLRGSFAVCAIFKGREDLIIGIKYRSPLIVGTGENNVALCSDSIALAGLCDNVAYLEDEEICCISQTKVEFYDFSGRIIDKQFEKLSVDCDDLNKGKYKHFMLKEILEQPAVLQRTAKKLCLPVEAERITILGCGSSYYAGCVAKYWFEEFLKIPTNVELASEFAYRNTVISKNELFLAISQSGETSDTISAFNRVRQTSKTASITNVKNSTLARSADIQFVTDAGPEISVASTKSFTAQLVTLLCLALPKKPDISEIFAAYNSIFSNLEDEIKNIARHIAKYKNLIFLGRGILYPIAMEAALKMKELTYIHAEAFAAGELKHGPLALVDDNIPIIAFAPSGKLYEKCISNINEVMSRGKSVIVVTDDKSTYSFDAKMLKIPYLDEVFSPFSFLLVSQLLAYYTADILGVNVDHPRNLAKSVTVE